MALFFVLKFRPYSKVALIETVLYPQQALNRTPLRDRVVRDTIFRRVTAWFVTRFFKMEKMGFYNCIFSPTWMSALGAEEPQTSR